MASDLLRSDGQPAYNPSRSVNARCRGSIREREMGMRDRKGGRGRKSSPVSALQLPCLCQHAHCRNHEQYCLLRTWTCGKLTMNYLPFHRQPQTLKQQQGEEGWRGKGLHQWLCSQKAARSVVDLSGVKLSQAVAVMKTKGHQGNQENVCICQHVSGCEWEAVLAVSKQQPVVWFTESMQGLIKEKMKAIWRSNAAWNYTRKTKTCHFQTCTFNKNGIGLQP